MANFFIDSLAALPTVASSPIAFVGLLSLVVAASLLYWRLGILRSFQRTLVTLPENDRLKHVELHYGVRPRGNVSATAWLKSRRQAYLFWAYLSTLLIMLMSVAITYNRVVPGGLNNGKLKQGFVVLDQKLQAFELSASNLRDAFVVLGEGAVDTDAKSAAFLTEKIDAYNKVYADLRTNQFDYGNAVTRWLPHDSELASRLKDVLRFALQDVHQSGILQFNQIVIERGQEVMALKRAKDRSTAGRIAEIRARSAIEVRNVAERVGNTLGVMRDRLSSLRIDIM